MSVNFIYGGRDRVPGITAAIETFENEFTWGKWENREVSGLQLEGTTRDTGNTSYTHILRAGLLLGLNNTTSKLQVWNPDATDGSEYIFGILKESRSVLLNNTSTDRLTGAVVLSGGIRGARLIIPGTTAPGIQGTTNEYLIRQQLRGRFMMDDDFQIARPERQLVTVSAAQRTSGITLTAADSHKFYFNTGGTLAVALGALVPYKGVEFDFFASVTTTDAITVSSGSANIKAPGVAAASTLSVDGTCRRLVGNGTQWLVQAL